MKWTDDQIRQRLRDAEKKTERGSALVTAPSLLQREGRTEAANALRLARQFGERIRYCPYRKCWYWWDSRRWAKDDKCKIDALAKIVAKSLWTEAAGLIGNPNVDEPTKKAIISFCKAANSAHGIRSMIELAQSEPGLAIAPDQLDRDNMLFNCNNGTIDLRTGKLRAADRADYITKIANVDFDPNAECPLFLAFLDGIFGGRKNLVSFIQRLFGYCCTGLTTEQVVTVFHGIGSNGKSTLLLLILAALGDYAGKGAENLLTAKKFGQHPAEVADLAGLRLVFVNETESGATFAEARLKDLSGSDPIRARQLYENFWSFYPTHKFILCSNHKPAVRGNDHAIWRRLLLVPFVQKFWNADRGETGPAELRADKVLAERLKSELPGILNWLISGCLDWQRTGLSCPAEVQDATNEYKKGEDTFGAFITECCVLQPDAVEVANQLLNAYRDYTGDHTMNPTRFARLLADRGFASGGRARSGPHRGQNQWKGLQLARECEA